MASCVASGVGRFALGEVGAVALLLMRRPEGAEGQMSRCNLHGGLTHRTRGSRRCVFCWREHVANSMPWPERVGESHGCVGMYIQNYSHLYACRGTARRRKMDVWKASEVVQRCRLEQENGMC